MKRLLSIMCAVCILTTLILPAGVLAEDVTYSVTTDEYVRLLGRGVVTDNGRSFNWPQSGFEFEFIGTKAEVYVGSATGTAYFNVSVDGGEPTRMVLNSGWNTLCENLEYNDHTVKFVRSSEAIHGKIYASEIRVDGTAPVPTAQKERKLEIYGDSYTAGYGNVPVGTENESVSAQNTDHWKGYASIVARHYDADANVIAFSGKGMAMNHNSSGTTINEVNTIPMQFEYADIAIGSETQPAWDHSTYTPDLIIIFLGTNDYRGTSDMGANGAYFQEKYEAFLATLKNTYPTSKILCLSKENTCYKEEALAAVEAAGGAEAGVYHYVFKSFGESGIDAHPNANEHISIANEVIGAINSIEGIWGDEEKKETISFNSVTSNVVVAGEYKKGSGTIGQDVMLVLRKEGTTAADIAYIDQAKTDAYGNYAFKFKFDGNINDYKLYVKQGNNDITDTVVGVNNNMLLEADLSLADANGGKVTFGIDTKAYLNADIRNYGHDDPVVSGIIAFYDKDGKLINTSVRLIGVNYDVKTQIKVSAPIPEGAKSAKGFLWYSTKNVTPIAKSVEATQAVSTTDTEDVALEGNIAIVNSVSQTKTAENEDALIIRFIQNGETDTKTITIVEGVGKDITSGTSSILSVAPYITTGTTPLKTGDVIAYSADANGIVDTFALVAQVTDDSKQFKALTAYGQNADVGEYEIGYITGIQGNVVTLNSGKAYAVTNANEYYFKRYSTTRYELSAGTYQLGYVDEYLDANGNGIADTGDSVTYVLIKTVDDVVTDIYAIDSDPRVVLP